MKKISILTIMFFFLIAGKTLAVFFGDDGKSLQGVLNNITINGESSVSATSDMIDDHMDSYWSISSANGSVSSIIFRLAAFAPKSRFGIFDLNDPDNTVEIFPGPTTMKSQAILHIKENGEVWLNQSNTGIVFAGNLFGYYLDSSYYGFGGFWYSDSSLNSDGMDHMYAYQGMNQDFIKLPGHEPGLWTDSKFILAFEDLMASAPSDRNYNDFVIMVESVRPRPFFLPIPKTQAYYRYSPVINPAVNSDPGESRPIAVGNIACGTLSLHLALSKFPSPVDIYLGIYAPHLSSELYLISPDNDIQPSSLALTKWKQNMTGPFDESLFGDIPVDSLTPGTYHLYMMVTPVNRLEVYYLWETSFVIPELSQSFFVAGYHCSYSYSPVAFAETNPNPAKAKPVGVGDAATHKNLVNPKQNADVLYEPVGIDFDTLEENLVNLNINLDEFSEPVDLYFAIFAPAIDSDDIYFLAPDYTFQSSSSGLLPWKENLTGNVKENLFGNIPMALLAKGIYYLGFWVSPTGSGINNTYYFWTTFFEIP